MPWIKTNNRINIKLILKVIFVDFRIRKKLTQIIKYNNFKSIINLTINASLNTAKTDEYSKYFLVEIFNFYWNKGKYIYKMFFKTRF